MKRELRIEISDEKKLLDDFNSNKPFIELPTSSIWEEGFETKSHSLFSYPDNYPNCCDYHKKLRKEIFEWYEEFPNCCDPHIELSKHKWFKKEDFDHIPEKLILQILYTDNFITTKINEEDWFELISDYISYSVESYGIPSIGAEKYLGYIKNWIKHTTISYDDFPKWKRKQILEFIESFWNKEENPKVDMNMLYGTFQRWLKIFPNLEYFNHLKKDFTNRFPLAVILYKPRTNRYTGITKFKVRTKAELIELLIKSTKELLGSVNTSNFLEKKVITNKDKYAIDLLNEHHSIKQVALLEEYSDSEIRYVKIIKKWLKNEKSYIANLSKIIEKLKDRQKMYEFEIREAFEKKYIKIFLRDKEKIKEIAKILGNLQSVAKCNITDNKDLDLTIYPSRTYSPEETISEIKIALDSYFEGGEYDPIFEDKISALSENAFDNIIKQIYNYGRNLEKYKNLYSKFDEEGFREFFLPHLNSISRNHTATGETFNKIGKTDILIQDKEGLNVFIGECKLWKGSGEIDKAIDQLLERYVTWRDEKVALIIFNKDMQNFTELIKRAIQAVKDHTLFKEYRGAREDTSFTFTFKHPEDEERLITLELIVFNCT
jgi:hypothetical protein